MASFFCISQSKSWRHVLDLHPQHLLQESICLSVCILLLLSGFMETAVIMREDPGVQVVLLVFWGSQTPAVLARPDLFRIMYAHSKRPEMFVCLEPLRLYINKEGYCYFVHSSSPPKHLISVFFSNVCLQCMFYYLFLYWVKCCE